MACGLRGAGRILFPRAPARSPRPGRAAPELAILEDQGPGNRPRQVFFSGTDLRPQRLRQIFADEGRLAASTARERDCRLHRGRPSRKRKRACSIVCAADYPIFRKTSAWLILSLPCAGRFLKPGQKVLLVLDQFEQWLHARRSEENAELVLALRHCAERAVTVHRDGA